MSRIFEFAINHYILVGIFLFLLTLFVLIEMRRRGGSVSNAELSLMLNNNSAVALDIRLNKDFVLGHITSSLNIPFDKLNERYIEMEKFKDKNIILIDSMGQYSSNAAILLKEKGFNVYRLEGGISNWQYDRLPLVKT